MNNISTNMNVSLHYPYDDKFDYTVRLERINMDKQREIDIKSGRGFIITAPKGIKKDVKNQDGIFSNRFGSNSIADADSYSGRYRCNCGLKRGSINHGETCNVCGTKVKYMDDDVTISGYLYLHEPYWIIHPNIYCTMEAFIGAGRLNRIIEPDVQVDSDGNVLPIIPIKKDEPFKGIGMLEFHDRFDEVMDFYLNKYPGKKQFYDDIMANKEILWCRTLSVYSSLLRPCAIDNGSLRYEDCNDEFNMLASLFYHVNDDKIEIDKKSKGRLQYLYDIQVNIQNLYAKIREILSKKKGDIRSAIGGRYCFSSRSIIRQDVELKCYQVKLPFAGLLELLQQVIVNILTRSYGFSYAEAYKKWYRAQITGYDQVIYNIMDGLIKDSDGLPVIINRNPTINYGGMLSCKVIGINLNYTMSISLLVLKKLAADFDGDTLNILYMYNKDFIRLADNVLNPRNMFISRNDGRCDDDMIHSRDMIINANSLKSLYSYNEEQIRKIKRLKAMNEPDKLLK